MDELEMTDPVDPEIVALFEQISAICEDKSLGVICEAMGLMLHHMTEGDIQLIGEGLQRIGNTAVNVCVETMQ